MPLTSSRTGRHVAGASQQQIQSYIVEAARCVAARSLAVFGSDPQNGIEQMNVRPHCGGYTVYGKGSLWRLWDAARV